ncbi:DinB family protein [bacterium]|nr:DinB family protein [bacterium]
MYHTVEEFIADHLEDSTEAQKLFDALTDESLGQRVAEGFRTLGELAWHIAACVPEMAGQAGLKLAVDLAEEPPATAGGIAQAYRAVCEKLRQAVREEWSSEALAEKFDFYGMEWSRSKLLWEMMKHEAHHRGQMTVLMRQAGLPVHGVYGPSKDEWPPAAPGSAAG